MLTCLKCFSNWAAVSSMERDSCLYLFKIFSIEMVEFDEHILFPCVIYRWYDKNDWNFDESFMFYVTFIYTYLFSYTSKCFPMLQRIKELKRQRLWKDNWWRMTAAAFIIKNILFVVVVVLIFSSSYQAAEHNNAFSNAQSTSIFYTTTVINL